ncbi:hypothetical protein BJV82DRAFT_583207 [Fennellomyces sp. T-0311]|nr:hypothetical protein BJV82DRAFT_583207 [Fennellomyces sp. T-0311]
MNKALDHDPENFDFDYGGNHIDMVIDSVEISRELSDTETVPENLVYKMVEVGMPTVYKEGKQQNFNNTLSKASLLTPRFRVYDVVQSIADEVYETGSMVENRFSAWDGLQNHLNKSADGACVLIVEHINLDEVIDFPQKHIHQFSEAMGDIILVYHDIFELAQRLFSHPLFADVMTTRPIIATCGKDQRQLVAPFASML